MSENAAAMTVEPAADSRFIGLDVPELLSLLRTVALTRVDLVEPLLVVSVRGREDVLRRRLAELPGGDVDTLQAARYLLDLGETAESFRLAAEIDLCGPWLRLLLTEFYYYLDDKTRNGKPVPGFAAPNVNQLTDLAQLAEAAEACRQAGKGNLREAEDR